MSADEQLRYELDMREKAELDYWSALKTNYRKGKLEGREEGIKEGIDLIDSLYSVLKKENKLDVLYRCLEDKEYRIEILKEYESKLKQ